MSNISLVTVLCQQQNTIKLSHNVYMPYTTKPINTQSKQAIYITTFITPTKRGQEIIEAANLATQLTWDPMFSSVKNLQ
jgi:hypothetical protein